MGDKYSACVNDCWGYYNHGCSSIANTTCSCSFTGLTTEAFGNCVIMDCTLYDCTQVLSDWNNACALSSYPNPFPNLYPCLRVAPPSSTSSTPSASSISSSSRSSSSPSSPSLLSTTTVTVSSTSPTSSSTLSSISRASNTTSPQLLASFSTTGAIISSSVQAPLSSQQREGVITSPPLGAILGGTMSGLVVLVLVGWFFWRRRGNKQRVGLIVTPYDQESASPQTGRTPSTPDMAALEILDPEKSALAAYDHPRASPPINEEMHEAPQSSLLFTHLGESSNPSDPISALNPSNQSYLMLSPPPQYVSPASSSMPLQEPPSWMENDALSQFVNANRDIISPSLELKLRRAEYTPEDNPADVSPDIWMDRYDVGPFELRRLQQAYDRGQQQAFESTEEGSTAASHPLKLVNVT